LENTHEGSPRSNSNTVNSEDFEPELIPETEYKGKIEAEKKESVVLTNGVPSNSTNDYEPELVQEFEGSEIIDPEEDLKDLQKQRQIVLEQKSRRIRNKT